MQANGRRSEGNAAFPRHFVLSGEVSGLGAADVSRMSAGPHSETTQRHLHRFLSQPPQRGSPCSVFAAIVKTAGAWAAARLQGGWERARPRQTQEGLLHLLSCRATHPHTQPFSLYPPPSPSALHQLRPAGETAGRCCQGGERRVRVCLCVCFKWSQGRSHG